MNYNELREEIRKRDYQDIIGLKADITKKEYNYFLEVLPPIYVKNGFMLQEPLTHAEGTAIRYMFTHKNNKYQCEIVKSNEYVKDSELIKAGMI